MIEKWSGEIEALMNKVRKVWVKGWNIKKKKDEGMKYEGLVDQKRMSK